MNNEFRKVKSTGETRFVLEFADGGATSSGSIASVEKPLGELQRRAEPQKPRNFVAKNAKMGGAGQHKDKKKAEKQGDVKHKKPFAEGEVVPLGKKHRGDLDSVDSCPKCDGDLQSGTYMGRRVKVCQPCKQVYLPPNSGIDQSGNEVSEGERTMSRAAKGVMKYGKDGMKALAKAGRDGASDEKLDKIRDKHDHYNEGVAEGLNFDEKKGRWEWDDGTRILPDELTPAQKQRVQKWKAANPGKRQGRATPDTRGEHTPHGSGAGPRVFEQGVAEEGYGNHPSQRVDPRTGKKYVPPKSPLGQGVAEGWSQKYKSSINCSHPKGFSQKAHCAGKKKHEESMMTMEATCPDCGMCQTHGNVMEIKKGAKDSNGFTKCWPGHHAAGTKKGKNGGQVRNCVPNNEAANPAQQAAIAIAKKKAMSENPEWYNDEANDMSSAQLKSLYKHAIKLRQAIKHLQAQGDTLEPWQQSKVTKAADYLDAVFNAVDDEHDMGENTVPDINYGIGSNPGKLVKVGSKGQVPHATMHLNVSQEKAKKLGLPHNVEESDAYMESLMNMLERSVSQAQHNLMVGVAHNPEFARKVKVKQKVGQEFANADQGHDISKLPIRVPKKK